MWHFAFDFLATSTREKWGQTRWRVWDVAGVDTSLTLSSRAPVASEPEAYGSAGLGTCGQGFNISSDTPSQSSPGMAESMQAGCQSHGLLEPAETDRTHHVHLPPTGCTAALSRRRRRRTSIPAFRSAPSTAIPASFCRTVAKIASGIPAESRETSIPFAPSSHACAHGGRRCTITNARRLTALSRRARLPRDSLGISGIGGTRTRTKTRTSKRRRGLGTEKYRVCYALEAAWNERGASAPRRCAF